jgi:hypothetical protein
MTLTTLTEDESQLTPIKTDQAGRLRLGDAHKAALLDTFESSGLSGIQFAKQHGLRYPTFISWVRKRKELSKVKLTPSSAFLEIDLSRASNSTKNPLMISLGNGVSMELSESSQVSLAVELLKTLTA